MKFKTGQQKERKKINEPKAGFFKRSIKLTNL